MQNADQNQKMQAKFLSTCKKCEFKILPVSYTNHSNPKETKKVNLMD